MSIIDTIRKRFSLRATASQWWYNWWQQAGKPSAPKGAEAVTKYHSWVYACAHRNATTCAGVPLRLYVKGKTDLYRSRSLCRGERERLGLRLKGLESSDDVEEITEGHPLLDLLRRANPYMTGQELFERTWLSLELLGNAHWHLEYQGIAGRQVPSAIWPLLSQYVKAIPDDREVVRGYLYGKTEDSQVSYEPAEIIHYRYPNPADIIDGMGPLQAAIYAVNRLEARSLYEQAMWDNDARPQFVLKISGQVPLEERERLREQWNRVHKGARNAGKPAIISGEMEVETLQLSPKDTEMLESARFTREEIAAVFGVPITLLEMSESNRASAEAGNDAYKSDTIAPRLRRLEAVLNEEVCPLFDERLFVAFDDVVPENRELELAERTAMVDRGAMTINEWRAAEGLGPVEWGDVPLKDPAADAERAQAMVDGLAAMRNQPVQPAQEPAKSLKAGPPPMNAMEREIAEGMKALWGAQYQEIIATLEQQWANR